MWGDKIRPGPTGDGVPKIRKLSWTSYTSGLPEDEVSGISWDVTYPGDKPCGFSCCGDTHGKMFDTWAEALAFALGRSWQR